MSPLICIAGKNSIAVDALLHLIELGYSKHLVVCPNQSDTGQSNWQPSLKRFARQLNIPVVKLDDLYELEDLVFISLEFDRILRPSRFSTTRLYNIHFSMLPAYKGMYTSAWPILRGESSSGVTLHEIDHGIDTGAIIAQQQFDLPINCTARDLYFLYLENAIELFRSQVSSMLDSERPITTRQPSKGSSYYSKSSIDYEGLEVNLQDTAEGVVRQLRAFSFREYQTPEVGGMPIGAWSILEQRSVQKTGSISVIDSDTLSLATIDYDLHLRRQEAWDWFDVQMGIDTSGLDPKFVNIRDAKGWTPLIRAAYTGNVGLCVVLLANGADPNMGNMNGTTPIMYASSSTDVANGPKVVDLLIGYGCDVDKPDRFGLKLSDYQQIERRELES